MKFLQTILLFYVISVAVMYFLSQKFDRPIIIPGDIYKVRGGRRFYVPLASSIVLTIVLYVLFRNFASRFG